MLKNKNTALHFLSFFFLPGIIIHELTHMLTAELLGVKTGKFDFFPHVLDSQSVRMGGVFIAKTDPLRRTIIGLSPLFGGLLIIFFLQYFLFQPLISSFFLSQWNFKNVFLFFLGGYFLIAVSNTMFSSATDLETIIFPFLLSIPLVLLFWLLGFRLSFIPTISQKLIFLEKELPKICEGLTIAVFFNLSLLGLTKWLIFGIIKTNDNLRCSQ